MRLSNPQPVSTRTTLLLTTILATAHVTGKRFDPLFEIGNQKFDVSIYHGTDSLNATHNVPITGYDITKQGNTTSPDWSFTIEVKDMLVYDQLLGTELTFRQCSGERHLRRC